jgi:peroxiredoxin
MRGPGIQEHHGATNMSRIPAVQSRRALWIGSPVLAAIAIAGLAVSWAVAGPPKVGEKAPNFELTTVDGGKVQLSRLLQEGPVVLVVLRGYPGYQCPVCTAQFADLRSKAKELQAARARVVLVYPGPSPELRRHALEFLGTGSLPEGFALALDPDYMLINLYGLRWNAPGETAYPSTFIISPEGLIRFARISRTHGDRARGSEILQELAR